MANTIDVLLTLKDKLTAPLTKATQAIENSSKKMDQAGKTFQRVGKTISSVGSTLTTSVTVPVVGLATAATKTAADFEASMSNVSAITGATGDDLQTLTDLAQDLGKTTAWSASEVADAMQYTGMAGWTAQQNVQGLAGILDLASASGTDLAETSDIMTDAISAFGDTAEDSSRYANVMTAAATSANVSVSTLGESYKYVGAVAGTMGYSIEDVTTALSAMGNQGIKASQAGTSLRTAITNMSAPTDSAAKAMQKLGISLTDNDGNMKSFDDVIANLQSSFSGLSETEQTAYAKTIFGKNAMTGMLAVINTSSDAYNQLSDTIESSSEGQGAAATAAATQLDNLEGQLTLLKSAFEGIAITMGNKFLPYLKQGVTYVQGLADKINGLTTEQTDLIVKFALLAASIGPALLVVGKLVTGFGTMMRVVSGLKKTFSAIQIAISTVGAVGSATLLPIIGIVAAIAVAGVAIYKNWDKISPKLAKLGEAFQNLWTAVQPIIDLIKDYVMTLWTNTLQPIFSTVLTTVGNIFGDVIDVITGVINTISALMTGDWSAAWQGLVDTVGAIFETIGDIIKTPINLVIDLINSAFSNINSAIGTISIPDWVPGIGGKSFTMSLPTIPQLAKGTDNWKGGLVQISEKGGEVVDLPSGSRVYPHDESVQKAYKDGQSSSSPSITVNIPKLADTLSVRSDGDIESIAEMLASKLEAVAMNVGGDLSVSY